MFVSLVHTGCQRCEVEKTPYLALRWKTVASLIEALLITGGVLMLIGGVRLTGLPPGVNTLVALGALGLGGGLELISAALLLRAYQARGIEPPTTLPLSPFRQATADLYGVPKTEHRLIYKDTATNFCTLYDKILFGEAPADNSPQKETFLAYCFEQNVQMVVCILDEAEDPPYFPPYPSNKGSSTLMRSISIGEEVKETDLVMKVFKSNSVITEDTYSTLHRAQIANSKSVKEDLLFLRIFQWNANNPLTLSAKDLYTLVSKVDAILDSSAQCVIHCSTGLNRAPLFAIALEMFRQLQKEDDNVVETFNSAEAIDYYINEVREARHSIPLNGVNAVLADPGTRQLLIEFAIECKKARLTAS